MALSPVILCIASAAYSRLGKCKTKSPLALSSEQATFCLVSLSYTRGLSQPRGVVTRHPAGIWQSCRHRSQAVAYPAVQLGPHSTGPSGQELLRPWSLQEFRPWCYMLEPKRPQTTLFPPNTHLGPAAPDAHASTAHRDDRQKQQADGTPCGYSSRTAASDSAAGRSIAATSSSISEPTIPLAWAVTGVSCSAHAYTPGLPQKLPKCRGLSDRLRLLGGRERSLVAIGS